MDVNPQKIYEIALTFLGVDASPNDVAPDEFGCAETVSTILRKAGCDLPITLTTTELNRILNRSARWKKIPTSDVDAGDVIISPTGEGGDNGITHGHTGIYLGKIRIASNDSASGKFIQNYTTERWRIRYSVTGRYPMYIYRRVSQQEAPPPTDTQKVEVAESAIKVATEAIKEPVLRPSVRALLKAILAFLRVDKLGAVLGFNGKIKKNYLG